MWLMASRARPRPASSAAPHEDDAPNKDPPAEPADSMFTSLLSSPRRRGRTGGVKIRRMPVLFVRREDGTVVAARRRVGSAAAAIGEWLPGGGGSTAARLPDAGGDTIKSVSLF